MRFHVAVALLTVLALAPPAAARPGDLDRSFGVGGTVLERSSYNGAAGAALQPDGSALFADFDRLVRFTRTGRVDPGFQTPDVSSISAGPVLDRQGRPHAITVTSISTRVTEFALVRLQSSGAVDPSFGDGGSRALPPLRGARTSLRSFGIDGDGRILVGGSLRRGGRSRAFVARFLADGMADPGFGRAGLVVSRRAFATTHVLARRNGSLIVAEALPGGGRPRGSVARLRALRPSGALDRRFGRRGFANGRAGGFHLFGGATLEPGPRGTLLFAGPAGRSDDRKSLRSTFIARFTSRGAVDRTFGRRGIVRLPARGNTSSTALARDRQGRIVTAESTGPAEYPGEKIVVQRILANGRPDRRFGRRGVVRFVPASRAGLRIVAALVSDVAVRPDGRILIAGTAFDDNVLFRDEVGQPYFALTRLKG